MATSNAKELDHLIEVVLRQIPKERQAKQVYAEAAEGATAEMPRRLFEWLAAQEEEHERKLRAALALLREQQVQAETSS